MTIGELELEIKNKCNFKWDCDYLKYLGVIYIYQKLW